MTAINFEAVSKTFRVGRGAGLKDALLGSRGHRHKSHVVQAVKGVSFEIQPGESVALLGANGSGKSTCLKLLAGTIIPTSGVVTTTGRIAPLLELGAGFHPDLTGRENIFLNAAFLGLPRAYVRRHLSDIIEFSGVGSAIDTPVRFYSSGMYVRLGFSVAVHSDPDIILIDEVLAVGDMDFQAKCMEAMARFKRDGRTIVLVTHALDQVEAFSNRALILGGGTLRFDGPVYQAKRLLQEAKLEV